MESFLLFSVRYRRIRQLSPARRPTASGQSVRYNSPAAGCGFRESEKKGSIPASSPSD